MTKEKLTQDEIDALVMANAGTIDDTWNFLKNSALTESLNNKKRAIVIARKRYEYALKNRSADEINEARRCLHNTAFELWLFKKGLTKNEYYELMNKEAAKRGLPPPFNNILPSQKT